MRLGNPSQPVSIDSSENIAATKTKLAASWDVKNLIAVEIDMTLMLIHKSAAQDIRPVVDEVNKFYPDHV